MPRRLTAEQAFAAMFDESDEDNISEDEEIESEEASEEDNILQNRSPSESEDEEGTPQIATIPTQVEYISKDGKVWNDVGRQDPRDRSPRLNILRESAGVSRTVWDRCGTPFESFSCFITNEILDIIIECTNEEGGRVYKDQWTPIGRIELQA